MLRGVFGPNTRCRAHLSAVAGVGATHSNLLGQPRSPEAGDLLNLFRLTAQGRVRESAAIPGLPPSPGRFGARPPYSSPSTRAIRKRTKLRNRNETMNSRISQLRNALTILQGGRQRVGRDRRACRPRGERERAPGSAGVWRPFIVCPPSPATHQKLPEAAASALVDGTTGWSFPGRGRCRLRAVPAVQP